MAEEVEQLLLAPFRDILDKGNLAIKNAEDAGDQAPELMLKAAQKLAKEGDRALKRIEPMATTNFEEYGGLFINAVKENDDIARFRKELVELLWDFDDYVKVDEFDASKFDELQQASRKAAPQIWDTLKRLKLLPPAAPVMISPPPSEAEAPMSMPTRPRPGIREETPVERLLDARFWRGLVNAETGPDTSSWRHSSISGPQHFTNGSQQTTNSRHFGPSDPPPTPPSADPWQIKRTSVTMYPIEDDDCDQQLPAAPDSPTIPTTQLVSSAECQFGGALRRLEGDGALYGEPEQHISASSWNQTSDGESWPSPLKPRRWTGSTQGSTEFVPVPPPRSNRRYTRSSNGSGPHSKIRESPVNSIQSAPLPVTRDQARESTLNILAGHDRESSPQGNFGHPPRRTSMVQHSPPSYLLASHKPSTESINSSVFDVIDSLVPAQQSTKCVKTRFSRYQGPGVPPPGYPGPPPLYQIPPIPPRRISGTTKSSVRSGLDDGLIPVDAESTVSTSNETATSRLDQGCAITPASSFYKLKGFCKGAEAERNGQVGFKKIKRPMGGFATATVAKCNHCVFELDYKAVEEDVNNESSGSRTSNTLGYRVRILQKCHLPTRVGDEPLYGCIFCIQTGRTLEESDATVFFSKNQLWAHLARHPRPFPKVPGVTVIEERELPMEVKDNFDLHFPHPPTESVMPGMAQEIARLPSAVATHTKRTSPRNARVPPDRHAVLQFAVGAKIVGIEFPAKYDGKWAIGWHDGVRGAFETDAVHFEAPSEVQTKRTSHVTATARWKWNQKGDDRWLKFDRWDIISNITWAYTDHWCWSGSTPKGWGVFPQSHLDPDSIRVHQPRYAENAMSPEKKHSLKFSFRGKREVRKTQSFSSQSNVV